MDITYICRSESKKEREAARFQHGRPGPVVVVVPLLPSPVRASQMQPGRRSTDWGWAGAEDRPPGVCGDGRGGGRRRRRRQGSLARCSQSLALAFALNPRTSELGVPTPVHERNGDPHSPLLLLLAITIFFACNSVLRSEQCDSRRTAQKIGWRSSSDKGKNRPAGQGWQVPHSS